MALPDYKTFELKVAELTEKARVMLRAGKPDGVKPEENTKDQLITPFLESLGYTPEFRSKERDTGEGSVDYVLKKQDGRYVCFFEAKHLWEGGDLWGRYFGQIRKYISDYWRHYTCQTPEDEVRWVCLGNYKDLYLYHTGDPKYFRHYSMEDYASPEKIHEIWDLLSRPAMEQGIPDDTWRESHREGIDERFLEHLKIWRLYLATAYRARNPKLPLADLRLVSQQILQRLIFIRLLERNHLQPPRWLIRFLARYEEFDRPAGKPFGESLRETIFRAVHRRWNTDLFREPLECDRYEMDENGAYTVIEGRGYDADFARRAFPGIGQGVLFEYYHLYGFDFATLSVDVIGEVYEKFLAHDFEFGPGDALRIKDSPAIRKKEGIYYTPTRIVETIVENTVGRKTAPVVEKAKALLEAERFGEAREAIRELSRIRVLDPAMGSGSFLRKVLAHFHSAYETYNRRAREIQMLMQEGGGLFGGANGLPQTVENAGERILKENIFGVDLDPQAIYTASLNLYHQLIELERDRFRVLAEQNRAHESLPDLHDNLHCGNSLSGSQEVAGQAALSFDTRFFFREDPGRFDVVLGNPPYVRADILGQTRRRQAKAARAGDEEMPSYMEADEYLRFRQALEGSAEYETLYEEWDLMIPFIERGVQLLRSGGLFGMIIKEDYCLAKYAERSQEFLLRNYHISRVDFYPDVQLFPGVGVHNIILYVDQDRPQNARCVRYLHKAKEDPGTQLPEVGGPDIFRYVQPLPMRKLAGETVPLRRICYVSVGFVGHAHEDEHLGEFALEDLISEKKDERHPKPYIEGKDIGRHLVRRVRYFEWGTARSPAQLRRATFPRFLDATPKLIAVRSPGPFPRVVWTDQPLYFNESAVGFVRWDAFKGAMNRSLAKSIRAIAPLASTWKARAEVLAQLSKAAEAFDLRYLLAILNSSVATELLTSRRRSKLHIYPDDYKGLPIPKIPKREQDQIVRRVEKLLALSQVVWDFPRTATRVIRRYPWSSVSLRHYQTDNIADPIRAVPECDVMLSGSLQELHVRHEKRKTTMYGVILSPDGNKAETPLISIRTADDILAEFFHILWDSFLREWRPPSRTGRNPAPVFEAVTHLENCIVYRKGLDPMPPHENADRIRQVMEEIRHELGRNDLSRIQQEMQALDREIDDLVFDIYGIPKEDRHAVRRILTSSLLPPKSLKQ